VTAEKSKVGQAMSARPKFKKALEGKQPWQRRWQEFLKKAALFFVGGGGGRPFLRRKAYSVSKHV
jgi:hypothetical protein